jgi:hypothetical protein
VLNLARDPEPFGCALFEPADDGEESGSICAPLHIELLQSALRRAVLPDAFDDNGRIKNGRIVEALDASRAALLQAAALRGPVSVEDFKAN